MRQIHSSFVLTGPAIRKQSALGISCNPVYANDDGWIEDRARQTNEAFCQRPVSNQSPLKASDGEAWGSHFHVWLGRSTKRYVCSVFPLKADEPLGGLPEFSQGIALAVAHDRRGGPICRSLFPFAWVSGVYSGKKQPVEAAIVGGAREWHIHLLAQSVSERRAVLDDLRFAPKHSINSRDSQRNAGAFPGPLAVTEDVGEHALSLSRAIPAWRRESRVRGGVLGCCTRNPGLARICQCLE